MSVATNRRSQPAYISSIFEVHYEVSLTLSAAYGYRSVNSGINCAGIDGSTPLEHDLLITYYAAQGVGMAVGNMHFASGKFFLLNHESIPRLITELSHEIPAGDSDNFSGCLTNNVALNSIGIIVSKRVVQEDAHDGKATTVFLMRHTDYNPMTGKICEFLLEYWCCPVRNLAKAVNIIQLGKEMTVHGYLAGKLVKAESVGDKEIKSYIFQVDVHSMSVASGHETIRVGASLATPTATKMTKGGRVRLQRATEGANGEPNSSPTPSTSANTGGASLALASSPMVSSSSIGGGIPSSTAEDEAALAAYMHDVSTLAPTDLGTGNSAGPSKRPRRS
ncbi:uncharacterized protein MELLADRAFT_107559 [Melampsora larici-populina 98AG31]|uniref:Uncharacterized protein n=1 Tax=Melampsora larici-populina (strain 98AG31 / pathotype 3-4-7) TaxID=747676 RepID=F4RQ20_MELLP|nr:uncharacterized protein MELLADRAFT_107559 [Melampsora larici-populina 98AG31]EGG05328.1 hypothetical protein MELLADRAFT_107559 [Melampsora larici-populina 98AG31]